MRPALATFDWAAGDHATYSLGDGPRAIGLAWMHRSISVDIETAGLGADQWEVKAVSIGTADTAVVLDPNDPAQALAVRNAIEAAREVALHNSCFDVPILVAAGLMRRADVWKVYDTLITARMADPGERVSKGLGACCERFLGAGYGQWKTSLETGYRAVTGKTKASMFKELGLSSPAYVAYAAFDVIMTSRLRAVVGAAVVRRLTEHPFQWVKPDPERLIEREQTVNRMLLSRNCVGIEIDFDVIDELKGEMFAEVARAEAYLAGAGVDVSLSREKMKADVVRVLDEKGLLPASHKRLKNGKPSAAKNYLERIDHDLVDAITRRSQADRFATDYADKLVASARNGRIHPQVGVLVARTGRMSYSDPPLQQFPASVRRMMRFDTPAVSMDWSSIEPVIAANMAGDTALLEEFESGGDLYLPVAEAAGVNRTTAKVVLLAQLYGQGAASLATRLGVDEDGARGIITAVMDRMPDIKTMIRKIRGVGDVHGLVPTLSGRILPLDADPRSGNKTFFGYKGINYYVQGSAYDLLAEVLFSMHRAGLEDSLYAAVHDELVVDADAADDVQRIMTTPPPALCEAAGRTPIIRIGRVALGRNWINVKE